MFDPFDAFDPFDPVPAETRADDEEERPEPEPRPVRRWTSTASRPVQPGSPKSPQPRDPEPTTTPAVSLSDLAAFRAVTLAELRAGAERLRAHGHDASVTDALDEDEPTVTVRFRPDPGPLASASELPSESARFELRLAPDLDGGTQVVAGFARASTDAPFTLLGRTHVEQIDRSWVTRRFIEFAQRVLEIR